MILLIEVQVYSAKNVLYMEEQLCATVPRTSKIDSTLSMRAKKYIRIYSAHKRTRKDLTPKEVTHKNLKNIDISTALHAYKNSHESSHLTFKSTVPINLEQTSKILTYDIQKAMSDKLELIRDLSTYEYNFSSECDVFTTLHKIYDIVRPLPHAVKSIEEIIHNESSCYETLLNGLTSISSLQTEDKLEQSAECEDLIVRAINEAHFLSPVFEGFSIISGVRCMVSLVSDKWLESLRFQAMTIEGSVYTLTMIQSMSNSLYTNKQLLDIIHEKLLPFLSLHMENQKTTMIFDSQQGSSYYSLLCHLKGYGLCNVQVTVKSESTLALEVPSIDQTVYAQIDQDASELFQNKIKLARLVQERLVYSKNARTLFWEEYGEIFMRREKGSKLFNEDYLRSVMDMGHFDQTYSVDIQKLGVRIDCFVYKEQIILKATFMKETIEIDSVSKFYSYLQDLQFFTMSKSPKTLASSLEVEALLLRIFPRIAKFKQGIA